MEYRPLERVGSMLSDAVLSVVSHLGITKPYHLYGTLSAQQLAEGLINFALDEASYNQILDTADIRKRINN